MTNSPSCEKLDDDICWGAVMARDRSFDGRFVTGVLSTGIYCRPSCAARHPRRENVQFFRSGLEAQKAGLRPCKRCRPDEIARDEAAVTRAIAMIGDADPDAPPSLHDLAVAAGYSPAHFQRIFTRAVGLSPAAYSRALRHRRAEDALSQGGSVTQAAYEAGYNAPSRFYETSGARLGMKPSAWRDGGRGVTICWAIVETTLGPLLVAATDRGVCRIAFGGTRDELSGRFPNADLLEGDADFMRSLSSIIAAVEAPGESLDIPLDVRGTVFQEAVWAELRKIPPGDTRSYAQIAAAVGRPGAVRAAGSANGANPVPVLVPCHRVVRSDGSVGGYAFGETIKRELLRREGALCRKP